MDKIQHFIVLLLENRSFDHLFGFAKPPAGLATIENLTSIDPLPSNLLSPDEPESGDNPSFAVSQPAPFAVHAKEGPSHSFNSVNVQLSNDKRGPSDESPVLNNGFARAYADSLKSQMRNVDASHINEVMQCFSPDQLPSINQLAHEFCLCDHWHCEVPGPTMPNRMFMHAATSEGYIHNDFKRPYSSKTVYELFEEKGLSWAIYFHDLHDLLQFSALKPNADHFRRFDRWAADIADGNLPNFTFLFPRFMNAKGDDGAPLMANSQHAPEDVRYADHLIADVYDALAANMELFQKSALVVTYDEHGGFYDHVLPGAAPNPDGINSPNPNDRAHFKVPSFSFDRIGLRVPAVIVSPWIAKSTVEHRQLQHTSVIKTVREMFGLSGPLNKRDESAQSFADLFANATPRGSEDMPKTLKRAPLEDMTESVVASATADPAEEPLDDLTENWALGMLSLLSGGLESVEEVPTTQGAAAAAIARQTKAAGW